MLNLIITFLFSFPSYAANRELNLKWDFEVHDVSRKYAKEHYPPGDVDAWWASTENDGKLNLLRKKEPARYRHLHAMVVAAFYAKRADHRANAFTWLEAYRCENAAACGDAYLFYDGALKATVLVPLKDEKLKARAETLRLRFKSADAHSKKPQRGGLCSAGKKSGRAEWLEQEYALFCPASRSFPNEGLCSGCADLERMKFKLELDSHQMVMSNAYLEGIAHNGPADCSAPWKTVITCGGADILFSFELDCKRTSNVFPPKIRCKEIAQQK